MLAIGSFPSTQTLAPGPPGVTNTGSATGVESSECGWT